MFKKAVKYALAGSFALGIIFSAGSISTYASGDSGPAITPAITPIATVDYNSQSLRIVVGDGKETTVPTQVPDNIPRYVNLAIYKKGATKFVWDTLPVKIVSGATADDKTEVSYVVDVNIGFYTSPTIEYEAKVYANDPDKAATVTIGQQARKVTVKYDPKTALLTVDDGATVVNTDYEVKTLYGTTWIAGNKVDLPSYGTYGATLCVRVKATPTKPASKEIKVKIPKQAAGPKATFNPSTMTVTIAKGAKWRIISNRPRTDSDMTGSYIVTATKNNLEGWIDGADGKPLSLVDVQGKIDTAAKVSYFHLNPNYLPAGERKPLTDGAKELHARYVKTADNDGNITETMDTQEGALSKEQSFELLYMGATLELMTPADKKPQTKSSFFDIYTQGDVVDFSKVEVKYNYDKAGTKVAQVEVKNNTGVDIQIVVGAQNADVKDLRFATLKSGVVKKYTAAQAKEDDAIFIRTAGIAATREKEMVWAGKERSLDIAYPKAAGALSNSIAKVEADDTANGSAKVTFSAEIDGAKKEYFYKIDDKKLDTPKIDDKVPSSAKNMTIDNDKKTGTIISLVEGKWLTIYECNKDNDKFTGYYSVEITSDMVGVVSSGGSGT